MKTKTKTQINKKIAKLENILDHARNLERERDGYRETVQLQREEIREYSLRVARCNRCAVANRRSPIFKTSPHSHKPTPAATGAAAQKMRDRNARLIAAAPELLAALDLVLARLEVAADDAEELGYDQRAENIREDITTARAAIAKAGRCVKRINQPTLGE